jgi:hypothetical protein
MDQAKQLIQDCANYLFPAKELFITDDLAYWAYDVRNNVILVTTGNITIVDSEGVNNYNISIYTQQLNDEADLEQVIEEKQRFGYECFASLM